MGEEVDGGCVYVGICASRHVTVVLSVGENTADWVWQWVCPEWDEGDNPRSHFSSLLS